MIRLRAHWVVPSIVCLVLSTVGTTVGAEPEIIFEDDFSAVPDGWKSDEDIKLSVEDGKLVVSSHGSWTTRQWYPESIEDVDFTVLVQLAKPKANAGMIAGIGFWALDDYRTDYRLTIRDDGTIALRRSEGISDKDGKPSMKQTDILPWQTSTALKTGADDWNELRVVTVGNRAAVFLNGTQLISFTGVAPKGGGRLGFYFGTVESKEFLTARYSKLKLAAPSGAVAETLAKEAAEPGLVLKDDFATLSPAWGSESGVLSVEDNRLVIRLEDDGLTRLINFAAPPVRDIDATVKIRLENEDAKSYIVGGLIFWGVGYDDYSLVHVYNDGKISASRRAPDKKEYVKLLALKDIPPEAKFAADGDNELRIVTAGRKATIYINGVVVGTINSFQIPKSEWFTGFSAETGIPAGTIRFSSLVCRTPEAKK